MKHAFRALLIFIAASCLWAACGDARSNMCSEYTFISADGWRFGEGVIFTPRHPDSICRGRLVVALRHNNDYPFTDIRLEVTAGEDTHVWRDTIDVVLAGKYGEWLGRGIGTSFQVSDTVGEVEHVSGNPIVVRHLMRTDTLVGINQLGIFFVPTQSH